MLDPVRAVRAAELVSALGSCSGWPHHDSSASSLYVVSGVLPFEFEGCDGYLDAEAGDLPRVSPCTLHRESNPTSEPSVAVIARFRGGAPTIKGEAR
ncbi:hypothetical protein [Pedococcus sp. 5OH_020]|uniref:hypothetical protein n=1 Tax=Pedococcus sp. 5OH_020 TaxID=2989814 RepID=UPI0022E9B4F6|nr:hypothetical protein [Pedococcus sp. 5OH_020]